MKQQTLTIAADQGAGFDTKRIRTRRDEFLDTMNRIVPWAALCALVEPYHPKRGNGRPPIGLEHMLRIHFIQYGFNLADLACEEALYDSASLRRFVGIDLGGEAMPDATTMLKFRHLLEKHKLGEQIFAEMGQVLHASGMKLNSSTIVDAPLIGASGSTKNAQKARDPGMRQTKKNGNWHFGMKLHIGVDSRSGLAHSAVVTAANVHDKRAMPQLLHGQEQRVYGDNASEHAQRHAPGRRRIDRMDVHAVLRLVRQWSKSGRAPAVEIQFRSVLQAQNNRVRGHGLLGLPPMRLRNGGPLDLVVAEEAVCHHRLTPARHACGTPTAGFAANRSINILACLYRCALPRSRWANSVSVQLVVS